jgi:hypothetical protein
VHRSLQVRPKQVLAAAAALGLLPLFQTLKISTDAPSLERAADWLVLQGAGTVADLRALPPGTYTCKELADGLGLPMLTAQRLLTALEGAKSSCHPSPRTPDRTDLAMQVLTSRNQRSRARWASRAR